MLYLVITYHQKDKKGMNPETNSAYPYQLQVKVFCNEFYCRGIKVSGKNRKDLIRSYIPYNFS